MRWQATIHRPHGLFDCGLGRLRRKWCDRPAATADGLMCLGVATTCDTVAHPTPRGLLAARLSRAGQSAAALRHRVSQDRTATQQWETATPTKPRANRSSQTRPARVLSTVALRATTLAIRRCASSHVRRQFVGFGVAPMRGLVPDDRSPAQRSNVCHQRPAPRHDGDHVRDRDAKDRSQPFPNAVRRRRKSEPPDRAPCERCEIGVDQRLKR